MSQITARDEIRGLVEAAELGSVELPKHLSEHVWYVKYESTNPLLSDTQHGEVWNEQTTAHERVGLTEDDGCVINFLGRRRGEGAITDDGDVLTEVAADGREDATGKALPRYSAFDFHIDQIFKTDGPELRHRLQDSVDNKVKEGHQDLVEVLTDTFKGFNGGSPNASMDSNEDARKYLQALDPLQRKAMIEMAEDELEDSGEPQQEKQAK